MSVTINGSGTVTGISVGGLPDGVITTDDIAANAVTTPKLGTDEASGLAKAWVNFNGTGTVAIRAQYNVSSITDNGVGQYTVNFATALADANYSIVATQGGTTTASAPVSLTANLSATNTESAPTTTSCRLLANSQFNNTAYDIQYANVAIFR
jgi:hypothetical protein